MAVEEAKRHSRRTVLLVVILAGALVGSLVWVSFQLAPYFSSLQSANTNATDQNDGVGSSDGSNGSRVLDLPVLGTVYDRTTDNWLSNVKVEICIASQNFTDSILNKCPQPEVQWTDSLGNFRSTRTYKLGQTLILWVTFTDLLGDWRTTSIPHTLTMLDYCEKCTNEYIDIFDLAFVYVRR